MMLRILKIHTTKPRSFIGTGHLLLSSILSKIFSLKRTVPVVQ